MSGLITDVVKFEPIDGDESRQRFFFHVSGIRIINPDEVEREFTGSDDDLMAVAARWRVPLMSIMRMSQVTCVLVRPEEVRVSVETYKGQRKLLFHQISLHLWAAIAEGLRPAYQPPLPSQRYSSANLAFMAQMDRQRARSARRPAGSSRGL